jgi:Cd2+/Zn2+-exporting ATPase
MTECSGCACSSQKIPDSEPDSNTRQRWFLGIAIVLFACGFLFRETLSDAMFLASTAFAGFYIAKSVFQGMKAGHFFTMEVLMTLATVGAIFLRQFEEAAAVVVLFGIGEMLEALASYRARRGIRSLLQRAPRVALLREGNQTREIPAAEISAGQILDVLPGAMVPTDGIIIEGSSAFDESVLTGESLPTDRTQGDTVVAGAIALDGRVQIRSTAAYVDNTFSRIIRMVEESTSSKAHTQRFVESFASKYTPGVMAFAFCVMLVPLLGVQGGFEMWFYKGLSVLLIGCPCALVISIPAAITSAISRASRLGILVKGGETLENIGKVKTAFFDKTGTITEGKIAVVDVHPLHTEHSETSVLTLAASVETASSHPVAKAIVAEALERKLSLLSVTEAAAQAGKGVRGCLEARLIEVLSPRASESRTPLTPSEHVLLAAAESEGYTVVVVHENSRVIGMISLSDTVRSDSRMAFDVLKNEFNIRVIMLTGDSAAVANHVAGPLGIEAHARCLPEDKTSRVHKASESSIVAMVGDGINDAPALACAQVGVAMGSGTDVAIETASVVLTRGSLTAFVDAIRLSRAMRSVIIQNVVFALGFKALFLMLAFTGKASLWMAIVADTGATLLVTTNALRLLQFGKTPFRAR